MTNLDRFHCTPLRSPISEPQWNHPTDSASSSGSSAKRTKCDYMVDKVLYSPYTAEYKAWKQGVIEQAREELRTAT